MGGGFYGVLTEGQIPLVHIAVLYQVIYHICNFRDKGIVFKYLAARVLILEFIEITTTLDESEAYLLFNHITIPFTSFNVVVIGLQCCKDPSIAV